jgi:hypothetical protein
MKAKLSTVFVAACVLSACDRGSDPPVPVRASPAETSLTGKPSGTVAVAVSRTRASSASVRDVASLIEKYCLHCHGCETARGEVVLDIFEEDDPDLQKHAALLARVDRVLRSRSMPPEDEQQPAPSELEVIHSWLGTFLVSDDPKQEKPTLRRLNRVEYNNTIRDLIGLDLRPADDFPADDVGYGFDNIGEVLSTTPLLLERYLDAADRVIDAAFESAEARQRIMNPSADSVPRVFRRYKPPVRSYPDKRVFVPRVVVRDPELERQQRLYDIVRAFADRAYRRPATYEQLMRLLGIVLAAEKDSEDSDAAIRIALRAVLVSPHFLLLGEPVTSDDQSSPPLPENDFDLASRLSYFLWSSMPDDTLFQAAARGTLRNGRELREQVRRMLADPRSHALSNNFSSQWLQIRSLVGLAPDPALFPKFDEALRAAMLKETELFCASILDEDRSVLTFLSADYTFVNARLARHYGIPGVEGEAFRRVSLAGTDRGGVLTLASVLTVTSNPTRTSPTKRGKWILENVLGAPPAPPPSGVEALKDRAETGTSGTLRQRMEQHRSDPTCAACHGRMDPLGFALENFDGIGGWRTHDGGSPIDASSGLAGGKTFRGPSELRAILLERREAFVLCFVEKMLTYALGRGLRSSDCRAVDQIIERLGSEGDRFSGLVLAIVESEPFQARTGK